MKNIWFKSVLSLLMAVSAANFTNAQISTPEGQIQAGGNKDTDRFVDKPSMHVHEQETVISKKSKNTGTATKNNEAVGKSVGSDTARQSVDSTAAASATGGVNNNSGGAATSGEPAITPSTARNQNILYTALTTFGIGALIGLFLLVLILRNKETARWMTLLHGSLGLLGIGMLIAYSMFYPGLLISLVLLGIAATGGLIVFYKDISHEPIPKWLALTHGVVAVAGVISLVVYAFTC